MIRPTLCTLIERRLPPHVIAARLRDMRLNDEAIRDAVLGLRSMEEVIIEQWAARLEGWRREAWAMWLQACVGHGLYKTRA